MHSSGWSGVDSHAFDLQLLGYPMYLENKKFARNAYFFNVGMALDPHATPDQTLPYHAVLCKFASYVQTLEVPHIIVPVRPTGSSVTCVACRSRASSSSAPRRSLG